MFEHFLADADVRRIGACFAMLRRCEVTQWALAGSVAVDLRLIEQGNQVRLRALNDLDFVTSSFRAVPNTLGTAFLVRHLHPFDPPNKVIAQFVSSELALRVDVFRTHPEVLSRARSMQTEFGPILTLSFGDLIAHAARLALPLSHRQPVFSKHASDFLRLAKLPNLEDAEQAWPEHRRVGDPESFQEAFTLLQRVVPESADLLMSPTYSQNVSGVCSRCAAVDGLELANPETILSILGYC